MLQIALHKQNWPQITHCFMVCLWGSRFHKCLFFIDVQMDVGFKQDSFGKQFSGQCFFINVWFGQVTVDLHIVILYNSYSYF